LIAYRSLRRRVGSGGHAGTLLQGPCRDLAGVDVAA